MRDLQNAPQRITRNEQFLISGLLLRHHQGLTIDEIADSLQIKSNAAKVRLFRARKAFAQAYEALTAEQEHA